MIHNDNKITWIASFPRSGNTWLRALITTYMNDGDSDINAIMQTGDKQPEYYEGIVKAPIFEWSMTDQALIKPAAMMRMLEDAGGNLMLKTHDCNFDLSGVAQIPHKLTRCAIYIARDPRDVALSFLNHYNMDSQQAAVERMLDSSFLTRYPNKGLFVPQLSWQIHIQSWMRALPYPVYTLRYEDLLSDPVKIFSEVVNFLKLDYDEQRLIKSIEACSFERMKKQEQKEGFREGVGQTFFHKGQAKRWEKELDPELVSLINKTCHNEMQSLNYL